MAIPTEKSVEINKQINFISGTDRVEQITNNLCTWCKGDVTKFKDSDSMKEYRISGLCQNCQDEVFKEED